MPTFILHFVYIVTERSEKSYVKSRACLMSSFVLDAITLYFYRYTLYNVMTDDCRKV